jgi:hypothetical protein
MKQETHHLAIDCMGLGGDRNERAYDNHLITQAEKVIETRPRTRNLFFRSCRHLYPKQKQFLEKSHNPILNVYNKVRRGRNGHYRKQG